MSNAEVHIDCDSCAVRGTHCKQCVVSVLLGMPAQPALDPAEQAALAALADGGLVPPLRLVPASPVDQRNYAEYEAFTVSESSADKGDSPARPQLAAGESEIARRKAVS